MAHSVYMINPSTEDDRPYLIKAKQKSGSPEKVKHIGIILGETSVSDWAGLDFYCEDEGDVLEWDFFVTTLIFGIFSPKAIQVFEVALSPHFHVLPVTLNGFPFFTIACKERLNILNIQKSAIRLFDVEGVDASNPRYNDIQGIDQFVFNDKELLLDPVMFAIPQLNPVLFGTESIPKLARDANLKGFSFQVVDSPRGSPRVINEGWGEWEWNE